MLYLLLFRCYQLIVLTLRAHDAIVTGDQSVALAGYALNNTLGCRVNTLLLKIREIEVGLKFKDIKCLADSMGKRVEDVEKRIKGGTLANTKTTKGNAINTKESSSAHLDIRYSPYPSKTPQVKLYQELVKRYGVLWTGGQVTYELKNVVLGRKFEADIALPNYKTAIEMDGYRHHGLSKSGFKRDRQKWLLFAESGWLVIPVSLEQLNHNLHDVMKSIDKYILQREYRAIAVEMIENIVGCKLTR
jgi:hypothetical protein